MNMISLCTEHGTQRAVILLLVAGDATRRGGGSTMALVCGGLLCTDEVRILRLRNGCEWLLEAHLSGVCFAARRGRLLPATLPKVWALSIHLGEREAVCLFFPT